LSRNVQLGLPLLFENEAKNITNYTLYIVGSM
jgi:hypothetical protein